MSDRFTKIFGTTLITTGHLNLTDIKVAGIISPMLMHLVLLICVTSAASPQNDLQVLKELVSRRLDEEIPESLCDSVEIVEVSKSPWGWVVKDQMEQVLLSKNIPVVKKSSAKLIFRLENVKVFYSFYRKGIIGRKMVKRRFTFNLTIKFQKDDKLVWSKEVEESFTDTIPYKDLKFVKYEGLSPSGTGESSGLSQIEEIVIVIAIGYIIFYVYSGKL